MASKYTGANIILSDLVNTVPTEGQANVSGYGIQGGRTTNPVYVHNHNDGGVRISCNGTLGTANGLLVKDTLTTCSGSFTASGDVTAYSDSRLKTDVEKIVDATAKVEALNGVTFTRTTDDKRSTGLIAQEVLAVLPEAVNEDDEGFYSVKYGNIVGLLVEAIKEQNARIQELENKLNGK